MVHLLILADDLTGSLDVGVQFAEQGIATQVIPYAETADGLLSSKADVVVVNASTRHLSSAAASQTVGKLVALTEGKIPFLFKKTDSALRGNVGAELEAMLHGAGRDLINFIPAYPEMGRTTKNGQHFIGETPLHQSVFGKDPFEPVTSSDVLEILSGQTSLPLLSVPEEGWVPESFRGITVFDCESQQQMERTVEKLYVQGKLRAMAGCAGLARAMCKVIPFSPGPIGGEALRDALLVICGSVNPITQEQLGYAEEMGFPRYNFKVSRKAMAELSHADRRQALIDTLCSRFSEGKGLIVSTLPDAAANPDDLLGREQIAAALAQLGKDILDQGIQTTLLITGGDTLEAFLSAIHCVQIVPICELDPGIVLTQIEYQGKTYHVITKSGGFGDRELLPKLAARFSGHQEINPYLEG